MTLIKSISGIRGTIGGQPGESLTPFDVVKFSAAFAKWALQAGHSRKVVIGRDARLSGPFISQIVSATLQAMGVDVLDLGLSTTPTVEIAVAEEKAAGGIILTASHNPGNWNALKLLGPTGEFISDEIGKEIVRLSETTDFDFAPVDGLGSYRTDDTYIDKHIEMILQLPLVDVEAIRARNFSVVIDCVNSSGGIALPRLLRALGVNRIEELYCEPTGHFPHNPEPLPEHLTELSGRLQQGGFDLGIVVDPDVDRLAFVCEDGSMFGEEYTLVAVADYVLKHKPGNTVSNLSSTRALRDVTEQAGGQYFASAVGEVNVVRQMKDCQAVIGGEGNGGIICPDLHYGRDALVGIALFLSHLAKYEGSVRQMKDAYPAYTISKNKIELTPAIDVDKVLQQVQERYAEYPINTVDGVKIEFDKEWVHLRKSNTEPIIRIYAESASAESADLLAKRIMAAIEEVVAQA